MDGPLETRPSLAANNRPSMIENDRLTGAALRRDFARPHLPASGPTRLSPQDIAAGVLMAVMMIGPLAAAAIGRMTS